MTNRIMLQASAEEYGIGFRTVSAHMKSPHRFYMGYDEFDRLQRGGRIISADMHSFAKICLDEKHDRIEFKFTWLSGYINDRVEGVEQTVALRWSKFQEFLQGCRLPDGSKEFRALSLDTNKNRPRLVFVGEKSNLCAAISNCRIRRKLGRALMANFNWPDADEIHLSNDFVPYSFFFREISDGHPAICGGLILHGQEDMSKAYYSLHT